MDADRTPEGLPELPDDPARPILVGRFTEDGGSDELVHRGRQCALVAHGNPPALDSGGGSQNAVKRIDRGHRGVND